MNNRDRRRLSRLHRCICKMPWPNRNRTLGVRDLSEWFSNCEKLIPEINSIIEDIVHGEEWVDEDLGRLEETLNSMYPKDSPPFPERKTGREITKTEK